MKLLLFAERKSLGNVLVKRVEEAIRPIYTCFYTRYHRCTSRTDDLEMLVSRSDLFFDPCIKSVCHHPMAPVQRPKLRRVKSAEIRLN
jgi:hypothetical protein